MQLKIQGGQPLNGEVVVSGAKNAATKMMIASLLTTDPVVLRNIPNIGDVDITKEICTQLGSQIKQDPKTNTLTLYTPQITNTQVKKLSAKNRISVLALAPLLHRAQEAEVPIVGGDEIGPRPVNFHIEALRAMGADITETGIGYKASAKKLIGTEIALNYPSVGATENIILAAVLAEGRTTISNAAIEPEIMDLIKMLQRMGAIIELRANRVIIIDGVERLHGVNYSVMPDRLEAASFAALAVATNGKITVRNACQSDLLTFLNTLRRMGADYIVDETGISFSRQSSTLNGIEIETEVWPGFSTDWQQPLAIALTQAEGLSVIHETVYENRFGYIESLNRMGAQIEIFNKCLGEVECRFKGKSERHSVIIHGSAKLSGTDIEIPDIRAGMAHVIAALVAEGTSTLSGIEHLMRGYDDLLAKLKAVGAKFSTSDEL